MRDPYIDKLAKVLVRYSTNVQPGQLVRISGSPVAHPLVEALYEEVLKAGGNPFVRMATESLQDIFYEHAGDQQIEYLNPIAKYEMEQIDVSIGLWADVNTKHLTRVDPSKQSAASKARKPLSVIFMNRAASNDLNWVGTVFPTNASAQDAEMSLRDYTNFVFKAGHLDKEDPVAVWKQIAVRQQHVVDYLQGKKEVHFQASNGTDLLVNVEGMKWINCCGENNFPDGEVFTGPNLQAADGGVNGYVKYQFPAMYNGREVTDVELWFEKGVVTQASATKNGDFLNKMLDTDEGGRKLGEIAIGTNYNITEYTRNTLFDEKIGGTFHAALGAGYPESGNSNESAIHWDMVCDLRDGGTITVDGEMISKDGQFIFDDWPGNEEN